VSTISLQSSPSCVREGRTYWSTTPEIKTESGIFDSGDALHALIIDLGTNILGIDEHT
jgi:hypothetical protein